MTQNTLSILGLSGQTTLTTDQKGLFKSGSSLPVDAIDGIDQQSLDAALEFAALLLEEQQGEPLTGSPLPALSGNQLPLEANPAPLTGASSDTTDVILENAGEQLLQQIAGAFPDAQLPDEVAATLQQLQSELTTVLSGSPLGGSGLSGEALLGRAVGNSPVLSALTPRQSVFTPVPADTNSAVLPPAQTGLTPQEQIAAATLRAEAQVNPSAVTVRSDVLTSTASPRSIFYSAALDRGRIAGNAANTLTTELPTPLPSSASGSPPVVSPIFQAVQDVVTNTQLRQTQFADVGLPEPVSAAAANRVALPPALTSSIPVPDSSTPSLSLSVDSAIHDPDWSRQFAERVGWVIHSRLGNAQVRLNPEHLGPVELSIDVDEQQARVQFVAAQPLTREAIEASLPRLRELLEQQGLQLADADVRDAPREQSDGHSTADGDDNSLSLETPDEISVQQGEQAPLTRLHNGLVDTYV